ncbi:MAG: CDP-alcohol phosphatidyltransferase family protein, partial [Pseudomonadota bacterium]
PDHVGRSGSRIRIYEMPRIWRAEHGRANSQRGSTARQIRGSCGLALERPSGNDSATIQPYRITPVTPNQLTIVTSLIGAFGVWLVLRSTWASVAAGAVLVQLQSVLDGCDGEVARLKYQSSRFGEWLDNVLDDFVNIGFGLALGIASAKLLGSSLYYWLGIAAAVSFLAYNSLVYAQLALVHHTGNPFAFRWWFQHEGADLTQTLGRAGAVGRIGGALRTLGRRDTFLLCFMLLAMVRLPHVAVVWYAAVGIADLVLTIAHLAVRIGKSDSRWP